MGTVYPIIMILTLSTMYKQQFENNQKWDWLDEREENCGVKANKT